MTSAFQALRGGGVLANWLDVPVELEGEFEQWYTFEHLPERVGIPGFNRARRFVATGDDRRGKWFTLYETDDVDVLESEAYLARLDQPTEWTRKIVGSFTYLSRTACAVTVSVGKGSSSNVATLELEPREDREDELREWLASSLSALERQMRIVAGHVFEPNPTVTKVKERTAEGAAAGASGESAQWLVFLELASASTDGIDGLTADGGAGAHGARPDHTLRRFRELVRLCSR